MAHAHKITKAKRRCKKRRKDWGKANDAALRRIDARGGEITLEMLAEGYRQTILCRDQ